jgi:rubrerythrin
MTTLVGIQNNLTNAVKELIELEYEAVESYETAVSKLTHNNECKMHLISFLEDHKRHISELSALLKQHNEEPPKKPSKSKQWIKSGKVTVANIIGDEFIIAAMKGNEFDTNVAYERIYTREDGWKDVCEVIRRGLEDEKRHKKWLEERPQIFHVHVSVG